MIQILLSYEWTLNGELQDRFWKIVRMPALPTIGMEIFLRFENDLWDSTVEDVSWDEAYPEFFEVRLVSYGCELDPKPYLKDAGWNHECEKPASEHMRSMQRDET